QDLNVALLVGRTVEPAAPAIAATVVAAPIARRRDPMAIVAAAEVAVDFDGTPWLGARVQACVRIGPACAGAIGRVLANDTRRGADVLGAVDIPIALGRRAVLALGAGVGGGWFQGPYSEAEALRTFTAFALRGDGHASIAVPLGRHVALHAGISV